MSPGDAPLPVLIDACLQEPSSEAWALLIARVQPLFARAAYRVAAERGAVAMQEVDDIVQKIWLKVSARGGEALRPLRLEPEQRVLAYLKVIAINAARDHFKARFAEKRGQHAVVSCDPAVEEFAFGGTEQTVEKDILVAQVNAALKADQRERTVFWLYYRQGFTAKEISTIPYYGLTAKGVESLIYRLTAGVKIALKRSVAESQKEKGYSAPEAF